MCFFFSKKKTHHTMNLTLPFKEEGLSKFADLKDEWIADVKADARILLIKLELEF